MQVYLTTNRDLFKELVMAEQNLSYQLNFYFEKLGLQYYLLFGEELNLNLKHSYGQLISPCLCINNFDINNIGLIKAAMIKIEDLKPFLHWQEFTNQHLLSCVKSIRSDHYLLEVWFKIDYHNQHYMFALIIEMQDKSENFIKDIHVKLLEQQHQIFKKSWRSIEHAAIINWL